MNSLVAISGFLFVASIIGIIAYVIELDQDRNLKQPVVETCVHHRVNQKVIVE